jgi:hypothetical protein
MSDFGDPLDDHITDVVSMPEVAKSTVPASVERVPTLQRKEVTRYPSVLDVDLRPKKEFFQEDFIPRRVKYRKLLADLAQRYEHFIAHGGPDRERKLSLLEKETKDVLDTNPIGDEIGEAE